MSGEFAASRQRRNLVAGVRDDMAVKAMDNLRAWGLKLDWHSVESISPACPDRRRSGVSTESPATAFGAIMNGGGTAMLSSQFTFSSETEYSNALRDLFRVQHVQKIYAGCAWTGGVNPQKVIGDAQYPEKRVRKFD